MTRTVARALVDAAAGPGGYVFTGDGGDRVQPYATVLASARAVGGALRARGLRPGDRVAIVLVEPEAFLTTFLGAAVAGLVPTPLPSPLTAADIGSTLDRLTPLVRAAGARAIVTTGTLKPLVARTVAAPAGVRLVAAWNELTGPALADVADVAAGDPALVQFTSGSTSRPNGVVVTHANLAANIEAIGGAAGLQFRPGDVGVSWLPLFHDMGLIGQALCPLYHGIIGVFLPPAAFLKRPADWLRAISRRRGTIGFAPNFAYDLCVRRVKDREIDGLDLSSWRVAGCGAEPIQAATLEAFAETFGRAGFRATSFVPAYGLAEHTLAVALSPCGRGPRVDAVRAADLTGRRVAAPCAPDAPDAVRLVSCGSALPGHAIRVVDGHDRPLADRAVGEILVAGPSVMRGYLGDAEATAAVLRDGWLRTGDLGYLADGELYVCGRRKEMIIVNGRNHFPQDLEFVAGRVPGLRPGRIAAFGVTAPGRADQVIVVAEPAGAVSATALTAELRRRLLEAAGVAVDEVVLAPKGTIGRTTSGKLRRAELRERYLQGRLPEVAPRHARAPVPHGGDAVP